MPAQPIDLIAAGLFGLALLHTFAAKQFERLARRFPRHAGLFHLLGEVEVVFGFWAIVLVGLGSLLIASTWRWSQHLAPVRAVGSRLHLGGTRSSRQMATS